MPNASTAHTPAIEQSNVDAGRVQRGLLIAALATEHRLAVEAQHRAEEAEAVRVAVLALEAELSGMDPAYRELLSGLVATESSAWTYDGKCNMTGMWMVAPGLTLLVHVLVTEETVLSLRLERDVVVEGRPTRLNPSVESLDALHASRAELAAFAARYLDDIAVSS